MRFTQVIAFTAALAAALAVQNVQAAAGGGTTCAVCTALIGIFEQLAVLNPGPVIDVMERYCMTLPEPPQSACIVFVNTYGEAIIEGFVKRNTADMICRSIGVCTEPTCNLFPLPSPDVEQFVWAGREAALAKASATIAPCDLPVISEWCKALEDFVDIHTPLFDQDRDRHSTVNTFRGAHWRGKDCDETRDSVYPGRKETQFDASIDHNCNGIYGSDETGVSYEDKFCANSGSIGLIFLGDSATAHFSIPVCAAAVGTRQATPSPSTLSQPTYLNATAINANPDTYDQLLFLATNELDWPQQSGSTGFLEEANKDCPGPIDSIYLRMRERNRCNHRDFQNIGVNGARVGSMEKIVTGMDRNETTDKPALVFYALIGNDVCNSDPTTARMTKPEDFKQRVLNSLSYLNQTLPYNSHVLFVGLVDGRVLWDIMNNETHQISPCAAWMSSNETYRNGASERAFELNQQYLDIIQEYSFDRFDMAYFDYPIFDVIDYWRNQGGALKDLIELADGFHPSQLGNALGTKFFWERLEKELPSWIGSVNPFNAEIDRLFGNQGGH